MKTEVKHTPGPWEIRYMSGVDMKIISENGKICEFSGLSHSVELMDEYGDEEMANAKLIAAAPELLKALMDLLQDAEKLWIYSSMPSEDKVGWSFNKAREAIKKAQS